MHRDNYHTIATRQYKTSHDYYQQAVRNSGVFTNTMFVATTTRKFFFSFGTLSLYACVIMYRLALMSGRGMAQNSRYWLLVI